MPQFTKVLKVSDLPSGSMKTVSAFGRPIALAHVDGQYFAVDDICTHQQCSLGGEGFLDSNVITCGCHGAQYDVTSGKVMALPAVENLASYQVKVEGNDILVGV